MAKRRTYRLVGGEGTVDVEVQLTEKGDWRVQRTHHITGTVVGGPMYFDTFDEAKISAAAVITNALCIGEVG
jgi:hypothetical protein